MCGSAAGANFKNKHRWILSINKYLPGSQPGMNPAQRCWDWHACWRMVADGWRLAVRSMPCGAYRRNSGICCALLQSAACRPWQPMHWRNTSTIRGPLWWGLAPLTYPTRRAALCPVRIPRCCGRWRSSACKAWICGAWGCGSASARWQRPGLGFMSASTSHWIFWLAWGSGLSLALYLE